MMNPALHIISPKTNKKSALLRFYELVPNTWMDDLWSYRPHIYILSQANSSVQQKGQPIQKHNQLWALLPSMVELCHQLAFCDFYSRESESESEKSTKSCDWNVKGEGERMRYLRRFHEQEQLKSNVAENGEQGQGLFDKWILKGMGLKVGPPG